MRDRTSRCRSRARDAGQRPHCDASRDGHGRPDVAEAKCGRKNKSNRTIQTYTESVLAFGRWLLAPSGARPRSGSHGQGPHGRVHGRPAGRPQSHHSVGALPAPSSSSSTSSWRRVTSKVSPLEGIRCPARARGPGDTRRRPGQIHPGLRGDQLHRPPRHGPGPFLDTGVRVSEASGDGRGRPIHDLEDDVGHLVGKATQGQDRSLGRQDQPGPEPLPEGPGRTEKRFPNMSATTARCGVESEAGSPPTGSSRCSAGAAPRRGSRPSIPTSSATPSPTSSSWPVGRRPTSYASTAGPLPRWPSGTGARRGAAGARQPHRNLSPGDRF